MAGSEIPESRFDPGETLVPETPDGYDDPTEFQYPLPALFLGSLVVVVTTVVHELVHGVAAGRYGYTVSYGAAPHMGAFYATPFHQFVTRDHQIRVALAPLVVVSLVGLPLLLVPVPWLAFGVFLALVFNATGAVGDLYATVVALRLPAGTLFYDSDVRHSYVFRPSASKPPSE